MALKKAIKGRATSGKPVLDRKTSDSPDTKMQIDLWLRTVRPH